MTFNYRNFRPVCLLLIVGSLGCFSCKKETQIEITTSEIRTITARVSESGVIQPDIEVPIAPDVSGEVTALYVKEGDFVRKGQLLFEIRPDNYRAALEQTSAALNTAKADYANASANKKQALTTLLQDSVNFTRNEQLFKDKVIPQTEFENFKLRYMVSRSAVDAASQAEKAAYFRVQSSEASVKRSADDLSRTRVYASMDGTVTLLNVKTGQRVVGTGMMSGTEAMKIADLSKMKVKVNINENDIVNIRLGDTASIEVDALKGKNFKGTVTDIAYSAKLAEIGTSDQVTNYEVKVMINPESYLSDSILMRGLLSHQSPLRPGMSAVVNIFTKKVDQAVSVPIQCVTIDRERQEINAKDTKEIVYLFDSVAKIVIVQPVESGISDDDFIEIKNGLKKGQIVVSGPYNVITKELKDQMKVVLKNNKESKNNEQK